MTIIAFISALLLVIALTALITYRLTKAYAFSLIRINSTVYTDSCSECDKDTVQFTAIAYVAGHGNLCQTWQCLSCGDDEGFDNE